jgi:hypothetical protein
LRLPTSCRRRHRESPERETSGLRNSRVIASRSSRGSNSIRRNSTTTISWAGVSVVCSRCAVCERSSKRSRFFHFSDSVFANRIAGRQTSHGLVALCDLPSDRWRCSGILVQGDHHSCDSPDWRVSIVIIRSRKNARPAKSGSRRGSMQSSGTRHLMSSPSRGALQSWTAAAQRKPAWLMLCASFFGIMPGKRRRDVLSTPRALMPSRGFARRRGERCWR